MLAFYKKYFFVTLVFAIIVMFSSCIGKNSMSEKIALKVGAKAPAFELQGDDGKMYKLSDYDDQKVVLFFYPRDKSYYCTKQACSLALGYNQYKNNNIMLFGINHQSVESHVAFKKKHKLPFMLLSDPTYATIKAYGAYSSLFIKRITVLIDKGTVIAILRNIDVNDHANQILETFEQASQRA